MKVLFLGLCAFLTAFGTIAYANVDKGTQKKKNVIILLGPPGSGKGTQAKKITSELNLPHISTGDLFRENLSKGTPLGKKVKSYLESGNLVPDEIVVDMLIDRVQADDCSEGYLLDGFPRSLPQALALEKELGDDVNLIVLNIQVPDESIVKRIEGRMTCKSCGTIFNKYFSPSKTGEVCDRCSGELIHRSDDNAEVVRERLKVYHSQTAPLEEFYAKQKVLTSVNGEQAPEQVFSDLMNNLK
ncbi:MAG: adenylate kinase [Chlamydiota bacterium]|nr:adenylate kinase [Chlamydiota bacterium]